MAMGEWTPIQTEEDICVLMQSFGGFHDSCIKELKYISGAYVGEDLGMYPFNDQRSVRMIFQRQDKNPMAIEMEFSGVITLSLSPKNTAYTAEILDASMLMRDGKIYWYDSFFKEKPDVYHGTWIEAEGVRWRCADDCMGNKEIYVMNI